MRTFQHQRAQFSRTLALGLAFGLALLCLAPAGSALAQDEPTRMSFVGFSAEDPATYAVVQKDPMAGDSLIIYKAGEPLPVLVFPLEGSVDDALSDDLVKDYKIQTEGAVEGMQSPKGYSLFGRAEAGQFVIGVTNGTAESKLGSAPLAGDPTGTSYASASFRSVHWTPESTVVVAIINQKLKGDWPLDADTTIAFKLK